MSEELNFMEKIILNSTGTMKAVRKYNWKIDLTFKRIARELEAMKSNVATFTAPTCCIDPHKYMRYQSATYCSFHRWDDPYLRKGRKTLKRMKKERKRR